MRRRDVMATGLGIGLGAALPPATWAQRRRRGDGQADPAPPAPKPAMLKTLMAQRGKPLYQDAFLEDDYKKKWRHIFGHWSVADRQLKAVEDPANNHHGEVWATAEMKDVVIQITFRFAGATMMGLGLEHTAPSGNDHLFRATARPNEFYMMQGSGWSNTTKLERVAVKKHEFTPGRWYTMVVEIVGREMLTHIDNRCIAYAEAEGIDTPKNQLSLQIRGDAGYYTNVSIWQAAADKKWPARRAAVVKQAGKPSCG